MEALFANFYNWFLAGKVFPIFNALYNFLFGDLGENDAVFLVKVFTTIVIFPFTYAVVVRLKGGMFWCSFWRAIKSWRWVALSTAMAAIGVITLFVGNAFSIVIGLVTLPMGIYGYYIVYMDLKEFAEDQLEYLDRGSIR